MGNPAIFCYEANGLFNALLECFMDHKCPSCFSLLRGKKLAKKVVDVPKDHEDYGAEVSICPQCHAGLAAKKYLSEFVLLMFLTLTLAISILSKFIPALTVISPYPILLVAIAVLLYFVWPEVGLRNKPKWVKYE